MSKVFIEEDSLTAIGDAIRQKTGDSALLKVTEMPNKINSISGGSEVDISAVLGVDYNKLQYICGDSVKKIHNMTNWANNGSAQCPLQPACGNGVLNMFQGYNNGWMLKGYPVFGSNVQQATYAYYNCQNLTPSNIIIPTTVRYLGYALSNVGSNYSTSPTASTPMGEAVLDMTAIKNAKNVFALNCTCKNITIYGTPNNLGNTVSAQCNNLQGFVNSGAGVLHNIYCLNRDTYNAFTYNLGLSTDSWEGGTTSQSSYSYVNIPVLTKNNIIEYKNYKYNFYTTTTNSKVYYVLPV